MEQGTSCSTMNDGTQNCPTDGVVLTANEKDDWVVLVEDGVLRGTVLHTDRTTGHVVCMSTRTCKDEDRWTEMPCVAQFSSLLILDLHKSRYLTTLDESVGDLKSLKRMILTRCNNLVTLPRAIGNLKHLTEVCELIFFS